MDFRGCKLCEKYMPIHLFNGMKCRECLSKEKLGKRRLERDVVNNHNGLVQINTQGNVNAG